MLVIDLEVMVMRQLEQQLRCQTKCHTNISYDFKHFGVVLSPALSARRGGNACQRDPTLYNATQRRL